MNGIAKNIKRLRQRKSLTQEELAERVFVTRQAVSNWETGKNQPDIDTLEKLSQALEVDIRELLYGPPQDETRRGRVHAAEILWGLAVAAWGAFALLYDEAKIRQGAFYDGRLSRFLLLVLRPLAFLLLGGAMAALISVWRDLRPTKRPVRRWMLAVGIMFLAVYLIGIGGMFHSPRLSHYWMLWVGYHAWTFLIPGAFLFCGARRKAG